MSSFIKASSHVACAFAFVSYVQNWVCSTKR